MYQIRESSYSCGHSHCPHLENYHGKERNQVRDTGCRRVPLDTGQIHSKLSVHYAHRREPDCLSHSWPHVLDRPSPLVHNLPENEPAESLDTNFAQVNHT